MKNTKKAFTLVELIVVITILAVLATVAFISLTGYSNDAKNAKVTSDVTLLAKAIETALTTGLANTSNIVATDDTDHKVALTGNVTKTDDNNVTSQVALSTMGTYETGLVDFGRIQQSGDDFKDNSGKAYIAGAISSGSLAKYQVVGQIAEASGEVKGVVKGNYTAITSGDVTGLVTQDGGTAPVLNDQALPTTTVDLYGITL